MGENIRCNCGFYNSSTSKFCAECGMKLIVNDNQPAGTNMGINANNNVAAEPVNVFPDDKGLLVLVDVCTRVTGMTVRDRYDEVVLYRNPKDDSYEIHKYSSDGYSAEIHSGYYVKHEKAMDILDTIKREKYEELDESKEVPICGAVKVLKFVGRDGSMVRKVAGEGKINDALKNTRSILFDCIEKENRIIPDYAKSWTKILIHATGMSTDQCYDFEVERAPGESVQVKGKIFYNGKMIEKANWIKLSKDKLEKIEKIPVGLLISKREKRIPENMMGMGMNMGMNSNMGMGMNMNMGMNSNMGMSIMMTDGEQKSLSITYGDGKKDSKVTNDNTYHELIELLKSAFV